MQWVPCCCFCLFGGPSAVLGASAYSEAASSVYCTSLSLETAQAVPSVSASLDAVPAVCGMFISADMTPAGSNHQPLRGLCLYSLLLLNIVV